MLKRLRTIGVAAAATLIMAATASAAPVIDFSIGAAGSGGNIVGIGGGHVVGTDIPIGQVVFGDTPLLDGALRNVFGTAAGSTGGGFGDLDFNTSTGDISILGCIPALGIGDEECLNPEVLLEGKITGFINTGRGIFVTSGTDFKNAQLLAAVGLPADTQFVLDASVASNISGLGGNGSPAISVDIINTAVPEPATMVLLGTGLLAAFRARRRQA